MKIVYLDEPFVAIDIKSTIYILDVDRLYVFDQLGNRLAIANIDDWLYKNTMWTHGLFDLKEFIEHYKCGRESRSEINNRAMLEQFVKYLYEKNVIPALNKIFDVEQLNLEVIEKTVIPYLRDNFEKLRTDNTELSVELFLKRLKTRIEILNPHGVRVIDGFINRLRDPHADLRLQIPDILTLAADTFLSTFKQELISTHVTDLQKTIERLQETKELSAQGTQTVLSR